MAGVIPVAVGIFGGGRFYSTGADQDTRGGCALGGSALIRPNGIASDFLNHFLHFVADPVLWRFGDALQLTSIQRHEIIPACREQYFFATCQRSGSNRGTVAIRIGSAIKSSIWIKLI